MEKQIKNLTDLHKFCHLIPKTELHAHLNGSIRKSTLFELLPEEDVDILSNLYTNQMSFENAFKIFKVSSKIITSLEIIQRIAKEMIDDWAKVNCMYLEIRTSLKAINGKTKKDYLTTVLEEIFKGNNTYEMETRLIISMNREYHLEDYLDTLEIYKNYNNNELKKLIVGIDYSGDENNDKNTFDDVFAVFNKFREAGLRVTMHAGEIENYQMIDFSKFKPDRISHTYFFTSEQFNEVIKNKIPIEVCPTGSYCVKNLNSYKDIPFKNYHRKKLILGSEEYNYDLFCINTDDTMLFVTDLSQEYYEIASNFDMTKEEIKNMILKTVDFIFETDENIRQKLKDKINNFKI